MIDPQARKGLRTWLEIDRGAIAANVAAFRGAIPSGCMIAAVVKSNAYGHGLAEFSRTAANAGAEWLAVDSVVEALALRRDGVTLPILVLGYTLPEMLEAAAGQDVSVTVSDMAHVEAVLAHAKNAALPRLKIHVKADTGMHRQGFLMAQADSLISLLRQAGDSVIVEGLYTHFAAAKNPDDLAHSRAQLAEFSGWKEKFEAAGFSPICHAAASAGAIAIPEACFDMVRIGAGLYGIWPSEEIRAKFESKILLKPALSWKTIISETKRLPKGSMIGYDLTATLSRDSVIAVCPVGYWHGYPRSLSNAGEVLVRGARCKVLGRVSMDMVVIDVTDVAGAAIGEEVVIIGKSGGQQISLQDVAAASGTSAYEIVTRINPLIRKIYFN